MCKPFPVARQPPPLASVCALCLGAFLLSGCTSLRTSTEPVGGKSYQSDNKARVGLYYFLPKAMFTIQCAKGADGIFTITVSRNMVADRRHRYFLRWTQNPFYDDTVSSDGGIATDTEGLLSNVDISTTDQTPAALNDIATSVVNIYKILGEGAQSGLVPMATRNRPRKPLGPFKYTFDPLDRAETDEVAAAMKLFGIVVSFCPESSHVQSCIGEELSAADAKALASTEENPNQDHPRSGGVFFHPPTTVEMRFDFRPANADVIQRESLLVPDPTRVACFRFGRSPLVERDTTLTLKQGMPTAFKISRKSPFKAATGVLSSLTTIVAGAIPTIVNVKVDQKTADLKSQQSLLEERKKTLDDQQALLASQKALQAARQPPPSGTGPESGALDPNDPAAPMTSAGGHRPGGSQSGQVPRRRASVHLEGDLDLPDLDPTPPGAQPPPAAPPAATPGSSPAAGSR